MKNPIENLLG